MSLTSGKGLLLCVGLLMWIGASGAQSYVLECVSVAGGGFPSDGNSLHSAISADGRYVVFDSDAATLVSGDTNGRRDVFRRDRQTGETIRVSVSSDGVQGDNRSSGPPSISADGRFVVFISYASNLVEGDTNGKCDVFRYDCVAGKTIRVSVDSSDAQGDWHSQDPEISADGRYVAFDSSASNLVSGDTNFSQDVFVRDCQDLVTTRVSVASDGTQGNSFSYVPFLSADGRYVTFGSSATNLTPGHAGAALDVFLHDRQTGLTTLITVGLDGKPADQDTGVARLSADGRFVIFESSASNLVPGDTNSNWDAFLYDRQSDHMARVSVSNNGEQADGMSGNICISADNRYVAFGSDAANLVPYDVNGASDVFVRDLQTGRNLRVSVTSDGSQGNADSGRGVMMSFSADGRFLCFGSDATNLVPDDSNGYTDVFVANTILPPDAPVVSSSTPAGWNLISLPLQPLDDDPAQVFQGIPITDRLYRYDPTRLTYVSYWDLDPADFGPVACGEGYWLYLDQPATLSYQGYHDYFGEVPLSLPLTGWYLIGVPHNLGVPLADCFVANLTVARTATYPDAAHTELWIQELMYGWYSLQTRYWEVGLDGPPINDDHVLWPWNGYWLQTFTPNLTLNVPAPT